MASGLGPRLPLTLGSEGGYMLLQDYNALVRQNLRMVLLTAPGERVMLPEFGVGLRNYIGNPNLPEFSGEIVNKIHEQVNMYLPFLCIIDIHVYNPDNTPKMGAHQLHITVEFEVVPLGFSDILEVELDEV